MLSQMKQIICFTKPPKFGLMSTIVGNSLSKYLPQTFVRCLASTPSAPAVPTGAQPIGQRRFRLKVEEDPHKLVNNCCGANYHIEGEEIKLKADEEYPEWLWSLPLRPPRVHELDPKTKEYWERLEEVGRQQMWKKRSVSRQPYKIVSERIIRLEELRWRRRFRAIQHKEFDAGYEIMEQPEREDVENVDKKERFRIPEEPDNPYYPGIDKIEVPYQVAANRLRFTKTSLKKAGRFGW
jgi:hypothetical protein